MKKLLIVLALAFSLFIISGCNGNSDDSGSNNNSTNAEIETPKNGQLVCTKTEEIDGVNTTLRATVDYENNTITNVRNETQVPVTNQNKNTYIEIYDGLKNIYKDIEGITIITESGTNTVTSIFEINYNTLDFDAVTEVMNKLGLEETDSDVVISKDNLDLDRYRSRYLKGYECNESNA